MARPRLLRCFRIPTWLAVLAVFALLRWLLFVPWEVCFTHLTNTVVVWRCVLWPPDETATVAYSFRLDLWLLRLPQMIALLVAIWLIVAVLHNFLSRHVLQPAKPGRCTNCNYELHGVERCPECGLKIVR